jgi:hypothetical protein
MTIAIGCICERGETVVLASDLRATYRTTPVGPRDHCEKLFTPGKHFPVMAVIAPYTVTPLQLHTPPMSGCAYRRLGLIVQTFAKVHVTMLNALSSLTSRL